MALDERIKIIIDVVSDKATASVKGFRQSVADADGVIGKFKAGAGAAFDSVKANAVGFAAVAGTALVGFGIRAGAAFQSTALEAGKFADAAGISVEAASKWTEVAGDVGVEAAAVEGAIRKMNQGIAAGKPVFDEFGDSIIRGKDGAVDADASFQNLISRIGAIEDPTLRARAAQDAFGKGYASMAELMEMSAGELQAALDGVSESKIIDEAELAKARDSRARIDELKDSFEDVQLAVGEFVSSMSPAITKVVEIGQGIVGVTTAVADFLFTAKPASTEAERWWRAVADPTALSRGEVVVGFLDRFNERLNNKSLVEKAKLGYEAFGRGLTDLGEQTYQGDMAFRDFKATFEELATQSPETAEQLLADMGKLRTGTDEASLGFQEWAGWAGLTDERMLELAKSIPDTATAIDGAEESVGEMATTVNRAAFEVRTLEQAWADLKGEIDQRQSFMNVQDSLTEMKRTGMEAFAAASDGAEDAGEKVRDYERAQLSAKEQVIDFLAEVLKLPPERSTRILAAFDQGNLDYVEAQLAILSRNRTMNLSIVARGGAGYGDTRDGPKAKGGRVRGGGAYPVGENFDGSFNSTTELFMPGEDGAVVSAPDVQAALRSMGGYGGAPMVVDRSVTNIYMPSGTRADDVANAQRRYRRTQGPT
jgi:hypothetical protein